LFGAWSGYGANSRLPYVEVFFMDQASGETTYQISPEEARRVGLILLECAEAAEQDANFMRFITGSVGLDVGRAAQALREFRGLREQRRRREAGEAEAGEAEAGGDDDGR
jgi:hypothetical protein